MKTRVECLDGLRGVAALWVLLGHATILTGFKLPIVGNPDLGVDLFILLSGFLMVFQYKLRAGKEDWDRPDVWRAFWIRRFFRLSPLYFLVLIVGLAIGPALYADRMQIDTFLHQVPQLPTRYTDPSPLNFLLHFTYLFGFVPDYAYRTPLPDWSLGLEMQFYLAFPFLIWIARRTGWLPAVAAVAVFGIAVAGALKVLGITFPMPTFLPLKLHMFLAGMLIALDGEVGDRRLVRLALVAALAAVPIGGVVDLPRTAIRIALALGFLTLVHGQSVGLVDRVSRLLGTKPFFWLGELSFGTYLIHLLVLQPVAAWLIVHHGGLHAGARFALAAGATVAVSYSLARIGYGLVEKPGQQLGRRLIQAIGRRQLAGQTVAEKIAAP